MADVLENVASDVRRGGSTFVAVIAITPNAVDPTRPVVIVSKFGEGPPLEKVNAAFAELAKDAQELGVLVPD